MNEEVEGEDWVEARQREIFAFLEWEQGKGLGQWGLRFCFVFNYHTVKLPGGRGGSQEYTFL